MPPRSRSRSRRWVRAVLVAALVLTAGCSAFGGGTTTTHDPESGYVSAEPVASVPANETVVDYSSDAVGDHAKLETALERAVEQNETVYVSLTGDEIDRAYAAVDGIPEGSDAYDYIRYEGTVVAVVVAVAA